MSAARPSAMRILPPTMTPSPSAGSTAPTARRCAPKRWPDRVVRRYLLHVLPAACAPFATTGFATRPPRPSANTSPSTPAGRCSSVPSSDPHPSPPPAPRPCCGKPMSVISGSCRRHGIPPRPAIADLALRMNRHPFTSDRAGLRPHHGHDLQGPRPRTGFSTHIAPQRRPIQPCSTPPGHPTKLRAPPRLLHRAPFHRKAASCRRVQTQTA